MKLMIVLYYDYLILFSQFLTKKKNLMQPMRTSGKVIERCGLLWWFLNGSVMTRDMSH